MHATSSGSRRHRDHGRLQDLLRAATEWPPAGASSLTASWPGRACELATGTATEVTVGSEPGPVGESCIMIPVTVPPRSARTRSDSAPEGASDPEPGQETRTPSTPPSPSYSEPDGIGRCRVPRLACKLEPGLPQCHCQPE